MMSTQKRTFFFLALLIFTASLFAQQRKLQHQPYADQRVYHFGFTLGLHVQDLILTQSGFVNENGEVWFSEIPSYSPGFNVGLIGDVYLSCYVNLRAVPTLYLGSKSFVFREQTSGAEFKTSIKNNYLYVPVQLKIAAGRVNNYKPYLLIGGYGSVELASRKEKAVLLKPVDYGVEIGFGCDFYLPLFKLSPELKFCFGLADVLQTNRTDLKDEELMKYAKSLSGAKQRMIVLSFNFE